MSACYKKYKGYLIMELAVGLTTLGILVIGLALSLNGFVKLNRFQLTRQQCIAAAQAQLDSIAATGEPVPDEDFKRLWPKLDISIEEAPGTGQWQAMKLVTVTAKGKSFRKDVTISMSRYITEDRMSAGKVY